MEDDISAADLDKLHLEAAEAALEKTRQTLDYVMQGEGFADLLSAGEALLDWARRELMWQPIETAPWHADVDGDYNYCSPDSKVGVGQVYKTDIFDDDLCEWLPDVHVGDVLYQKTGAVLKPTHWRPILETEPDKLPAPLEALGAVLRRVKGTT